MSPSAFKSSLAEDNPSPHLSRALQSLWWVAKGDWDKAHAIVQGESSASAAWVHAYLHRVEGDIGNAHYWYAQAGRKPLQGSMDAEFADVLTALLRRAQKT